MPDGSVECEVLINGKRQTVTGQVLEFGKPLGGDPFTILSNAAAVRLPNGTVINGPEVL